MRFKEVGENTAAKFAGILPHEFAGLAELVDFPRQAWRDVKWNIFSAHVATFFWLSIVYFSDKVGVGKAILAHWQWFIPGNFCLGILASAFRLIFAYPEYLRNRRSLAQQTLRQVKLLDGMFQLQKV